MSVDISPNTSAEIGSLVRLHPKPEKIKLPDKNMDKDNRRAAAEVILIIYPEIVKLHEIEQNITTPGEAISQLQPMLFSSDPVVRLATLESIAELTTPQSFAALVNSLDDKLPLIRKMSIEGLVLQAGDNIAGVVEPFLFDQDFSVRIAAINALAELGGEQSISSLAALLADHDPVIRNNAVIALGEIDSLRNSQYILPLQYDPDRRVRNNAQSILIEQGVENNE